MFANSTASRDDWTLGYEERGRLGAAAPGAGGARHVAGCRLLEGDGRGRRVPDWRLRQSCAAIKARETRVGHTGTVQSVAFRRRRCGALLGRNRRVDRDLGPRRVHRASVLAGRARAGPFGGIQLRQPRSGNRQSE